MRLLCLSFQTTSLTRLWFAQIGAAMLPQHLLILYSCVTCTWRAQMVTFGSHRSGRADRVGVPVIQSAFFPDVPVAKSNIIGVFLKCQDTEAVSQLRGWILLGPHCSCRYVITSQGANKNRLILHFTGHLKVRVKNLEKICPN